MRYLPSLLAVAVVAAACGSSAGGGATEAADDESRYAASQDDVHATVATAVADLETFWSQTYPAVFGGEWRPLGSTMSFPPPNVHSYDSENPPTYYNENGEPVMLICYEGTREEWAESYERSYVGDVSYCNYDDAIVWDADPGRGLIPEASLLFGPQAVAAIIAHEYGHVAEERREEAIVELQPDPSVWLELQADCYSGAHAAWIAGGSSSNFRPDPTMLDQTVASLFLAADVPGTAPADPGAHGSAFDMFHAFHHGFAQGAGACVPYTDAGPAGELPLVEIPFASPEEEATGGNLPLWGDESRMGILTMSTLALNAYYDAIFRERFSTDFVNLPAPRVTEPTETVTCDGQTLTGTDLAWAARYCIDENVALVGGDMVRHVYGNMRHGGDFAVASELAQLWATAAQHQRGAVPSDPVVANHQAHCLTGAWTHSFWPDQSGNNFYRNFYLNFPHIPHDPTVDDMTLAPGDLDEVLAGMLRHPFHENVYRGNALDRLASFQTGFLDGIETCGL